MDRIHSRFVLTWVGFLELCGFLSTKSEVLNQKSLSTVASGLEAPSIASILSICDTTGPEQLLLFLTPGRNQQPA